MHLKDEKRSGVGVNLPMNTNGIKQADRKKENKKGHNSKGEKQIMKVRV